jgi:meso-butanediol dehydrogenase/(S,S)-butanediol dehydrogenase/diacetyl reductase
MSLDNKVAVVTGAGQGIGRGIALRLASEGADIGAIDKNSETAKAVCKEIEALGRKALPLTADVSVCDEIFSALENIVRHFGRVDILVYNARVVQTKAMLDITEEDWDRVMSINAKGTFFCTQAIAKQMTKQSSGLIINITSGQRARPMAAHYAASKMAVDIITMTAALALAPHKIRVNAIDPNIVRTPMWKQLDDERVRLFGLPPGEAARRWEEGVPLGAIATPEQIGGVVIFLASNDASSITGQIIRMTGGSDLATFEKAQGSNRKS